MTIADYAFQEYFSFDEAECIAKCVDKPCKIEKAYECLNMYHPHLKLLSDNSNKRIKTWVKEYRTQQKFSDKHKEKFLYCLDFIKKSENDLLSEGIKSHDFAITLKTLEHILNQFYEGQLSNLNYFMQERTNIQNMQVSSYIIGVLIPQLYKNIFGTKWTYTNTCIDYDEPYGPGIRFTEKILEKYKIQADPYKITKAYQRVKKATKS